jgi:acetylglutamate kinase
VVAPVGIGSNGDAYNINSDLAASAVSIAIKAEKLIILTDVDGIHDRNGGNISSINLSKLESLKESGVITGGMIPKILGISEAIKAGVSKVHIIDGRVKHSILLELFTDTGIGTEIIDDE